METLNWLAQYIFLLAIPYFYGLMAWEWFALKKRAGTRGYEWKDSLVSMTLGLFKLGTLTLAALYSGHVFMWVYQYRVFDFSPLVWWTWPLLWVVEDFTYYWYHRSSHRVRCFWAEHVNHHSSQHYNLSTALRQSTVGPLYIWILWLWLPLAGFHPVAVVVTSGFSLLYQYWIHTEAIVKCPRWFEAVFNTPSHHRVHHGSNGVYIDKNYAGWLMCWDKWFGTFQPEDPAVPVRYGLVHNINTYNLPTVIFHEWAHILRRVRQSKSLREAIGWSFGPPEWTPDGPNYPPDHPARQKLLR